MGFATLAHQPNDETQVRVSKTQGSPDLVQGVRRVGDQLSQEDLLVAEQTKQSRKECKFMKETYLNLDDTD